MAQVREKISQLRASSRANEYMGTASSRRSTSTIWRALCVIDDAMRAAIGSVRHLPAIAAGLALAGSGAAPAELRKKGSPEEIVKFITLGTIVWFTATWAFVGALFFFSQLLGSHDRASFAVVAMAVIWGGMIFSIDRLFLSTMLGQTGFRRLSMGLVRVALAALLGYVISHPLKLQFFDKVIEGHNLEMRQALIDEESRYLKRELHQIDKQIEPINEKIDLIQANDARFRTIKRARREMEFLNRVVQAENVGSGTVIDQGGKLERFVRIDFPNKPDATAETTSKNFTHMTISGPRRAGCGQLDSGFAAFDPADPGHGEPGVVRALIKKHQVWEKKKQNIGVTNCTLALIARSLWVEKVEALEKQLPPKENSLSVLLTQQEQVRRQLSDQRSSVVQKLSNVEADVTQRQGAGYAQKTRVYLDLARTPVLFGGAAVAADKPRPAIEGQQAGRAAAEPSVEIFFIGLGVTLIFIFVEIAPVLTKMLSSKGPYEAGIAFQLAEMRTDKGKSFTLERDRQREVVNTGATINARADEFESGMISQLLGECDQRVAKAADANERNRLFTDVLEQISRVRQLAAGARR